MIVFIIGKKLSGKSTRTKEFLKRTKKRVVIFDPVGEYEVDKRFSDAETFEEAIKAGDLPKRVAITLNDITEGDVIFAWCWNLKSHLLVIDEFHLYGNAWSMPKSLQRIFRMGRHRGIDVIGITHRFIDLPQIIITQCDALIMFRQQGIRDIEAIERVTDTETAERVMQLREHEFLEYKF